MTTATLSASRTILYRSHGSRHGPIARLVSPGDVGQMIKPFIFLDHFESPAGGKGPGFGMHPHSGIATLTYLMAGQVDYEDTTGTHGARGTLPAGGVEWMMAGGGVWHTGGPHDSGRVLGFQLWVAMPPALELAEAYSLYLGPQDLPRVGPARVLLGSFGGQTNPIPAPSDMTYLGVQLKAGETVLVLGAAGGVGTAAIQIAKAMGARVIAAASTQEKCALCTSIGADATINYSTENLREAVKALTNGKGPDVIYDPVGGDFAEPAFRSIAWRGRYLVVGFASGPIPALPFNLALLKGASIVGVFWGDFAKREPQANGAMMMELAQWYGQGKIKPVIDSTMPMVDLKAAYAHMGSRGVKGKLVMVNPTGPVTSVG